jgi:hypothetical protein
LQIDTHGKAIQGEATWENSDGMKSRIAVPTRDQKIYIFDLDVPKQPIILKVAENGGVFGMSAPLWWHSAKGETFIFVGGLDKLSRFDLRDATHPAKFTIPAQTAHHLTLLTLANGKTVVAVATWDGKIYLFDPEDLDHPSILDTKIPKGRIDENPTLVITPDQRMFLAVAVYDQGVFVFDLADTENPIRMPIGRTFTSAPAWHTAPSGDIYLSVGDAGGNLYVTTFYSKSGRK